MLIHKDFFPMVTSQEKKIVCFPFFYKYVNIKESEGDILNRMHDWIKNNEVNIHSIESIEKCYYRLWYEKPDTFSLIKRDSEKYEVKL